MSNDQSFKNRKPAMGKAEPGTIKRIFSYIFQYKWRVIAIVVCILVGAAAQAGSALFLQSLIDTYILPMVGESNSDWAPLLRAISLMAGLYVAGIVASWLWQWLIVTVEQGTLKKIRDDMFAHQQKLPIRYFDSHEHGDIMSHYTNDTDTLRQAISQSFPQMFSSIISAVAAAVHAVAVHSIHCVRNRAFCSTSSCAIVSCPAATLSRVDRRRERLRGGIQSTARRRQGLQSMKTPSRRPSTRRTRGVGQRHHAGRRQHGLPALHPACHRRRRRLAGRRQRHRSDRASSRSPSARSRLPC